MKIKSIVLSTMSLACLLGSGVRANIILQDNFDSYSTGDLAAVSGGVWSVHSGTTGPINVVADDSASAPNAIQVTGYTEDYNATLADGPYYTAGTNALGDPVTALYYKFTMRVSSGDLPTGPVYFAHFNKSGFRGKTWVSDGTVAGLYRVGVTGSSSSSTYVNYWPTDLSPDTTYVIVVRYVLVNGETTLWVNPSSESDMSITNTDATSIGSIYEMAFRQSGGEGTKNVDDLVVGTSFSDVLSGKPLVVHEPEDKVSFVGAAVSFSADAFGAPPVDYKWYYNTNTPLVESSSVIGANSNVLTLTDLSLAQAGIYSCVVSNSFGTNVTRFALLSVYSAPEAPTITNQPTAGSTNIVGDNVTLSVVAGGVPPPVYQWKVISDGVTNDVTGANVSGADSDTLILTGVTTNQTGEYFVTITNVVGATNSSLATLLVNPSPVLNIVDLRAMVDSGTLVPTNTTSIYITEGIVTTWTNLTSSGNSEFFIQDGSGGIAVYWAGAPAAANLPPAGAMVRVTAPLSSFHGLIELAPSASNPQTSVEVLSTGNPLPTAQPLPFDPNILNDPVTMEKLEGTYFVASNVTLTAGQFFVGGSTESITNNVYHIKTDDLLGLSYTNDAGQAATIYINYYTDVQNQPKYSGPVTMFGVLGNYNGTYELIPTRYADIISYIHVTNVVTNVKHYGDLLTNNYAENVLRPGETQTSFESIGDPEGGTVTLTPVTGGLPASASWSNISSGSTGTAVFHFTPEMADSGSNYVVSLAVSSSSGGAFTNSFTVYVPTADEQKIAISEFLANPTTDTGAPNFNPLHRATDTNNVSSNDQFIEIANQSGADMYLYGWGIYDDSGTLVQDFSLFAPTLYSSNAYVVYGGPSDYTDLPNLPVDNELATSGGLSLPTSGTGTIVLRNGNGNIVDRVVYTGSDLNTKGSLTRFPTIDSRFVPQPYVSTNLNTPGIQYDGVSWASATSIPQGVIPVSVSVSNNQVFLNFTAETTKASTLWRADNLTDPFMVVNGGQFASPNATFTETNLPSKRFYYITTQQ